MFPITIVVIKIKHIIKGRGLVNQVMFAAGFVLLVWAAWRYFHGGPVFVPKYLRRYLRFPEGYTIPERELSEEELEKLTSKVEKWNVDAEVFNWARHGAVREETPIIAIQVHKDVERLQYLIVSLGQVHFIQQVLLVFSHSYYDEKMNELIRSIHFCKYMQIFYPYSLQLHPNRFPGVDPDDCNGTTARGEARTCNERDARLTEHKQHWWWKAHFIFDGLEMRSNRRAVVFLEEDDYALPDLLYVMRYLRRTLAYFPSALVMALGRAPAAGLAADELLVDAWTPLRARGLALNGSAWRRVAALAARFCMYDDCSWSYSLAHLFAGFPGGLVDVAAVMAPRVLPTRLLDNKSAGRAAQAAWALGARSPLFPGEARVAVTVGAGGRLRREWRPPPGAGGWADLRDQLLCLEARVATTQDLTTNTLPAPYEPRNNSSPR